MTVVLVRRCVQEALGAQLARTASDFLGGVALQHETDERRIVRMLRLNLACGVAILGDRNVVDGTHAHGRADELADLEWRRHLPLCAR